MENSSSKKKVLGLWILTALVTGNMIGSGIFVLPSSLAAFGSISLISWGFTTAGAICLAMVFAHMARLIKKPGGPYQFCMDAFGKFPGFQMAYCYWVALWTGNAAIVIALTGYLSTFFPSLADHHAQAFLVSMAFLWGFTLINAIGVREAGIVQLITTLLKLIPLILIATLGFFFIHPHNLTSFNVSHQSNFSALSAAATLTMWSFVGLESATIPSDLVKDPDRNIPRATIIGTLIAASVYILSTAAIMGMIPADILKNSPAPFADAARIMFGPWGEDLVAIGAIISCLGALNGWILLQAKVPQCAAEDNLFPKVFKKVNARGAPVTGLLISSALISILLAMNYTKSFVNQFTLVILLATLSSLIPYLFVAMARLMLFIQGRGDLDKKQMTRAVIVTLLAFVYIFWAIAGSGQDTLYYGSLLLFSSVPLYVFVQWRLSRFHPERS